MDGGPSPPRDGSIQSADDGVAQKACMAFPAPIRSRVSSALRANGQVWSSLSWARRLELVQAEAISLRKASAAAFESLLSSAAQPDFGRDLPASADVILSCAASSDELCITLEAAAKPQRSPIHCIIVLDVSGSMDHSAAQAAPGSSQEDHVKFTRLDLAKHSSKAVVEVMGDDDHVTIISFGSEADVQLQKTRMTQEGKARAQAVVDSLCTAGATNLIAANKLALSCAMADAQCSNIHIIVLTDGEPGQPDAVLPAFVSDMAPLEHARVAGRHHGVCVSTFGFGYDMNSELLLQMSVAGHGAFSYIPDSSMIGTVFCNFIANAMCVACSCIDVEIQLQHASFAAGSPNRAAAPDRLSFAVSSLQRGQPRHFMFKLQRSSSFSVRAVAVVHGSSAAAMTWVDPQPQFPLLTEQRALASYMQAIENAALLTVVAAGSLEADSVLQMLQDLPPASTSEFIHGLHRDIRSESAQEGQVLIGLSNPEFKYKWGIHYTRSLWSAHRLQQCHNFKDPGVQLYGGPMFRAIADAADAAFCALPAPKCTDKRRAAPTPAYASYAEPVDMSMFMDRYGGCFAPQSPVKLFDGTSCEIQYLRRGMLLWGGACVQLVLRMNYNAVVPMVCLDSAGDADSVPVAVTPWHPVLVAGKWKFPCSIRSPAPMYMDCVYNLVLSTGHVIDVNGLQFITLGHGNVSDPVLAHAFFGTQAVVRAMLQRGGGQDVVAVSGVVRDRNGHVCGFVHDEEPECARFTQNCSRLLQVS